MVPNARCPVHIHLARPSKFFLIEGLPSNAIHFIMDALFPPAPRTLYPLFIECILHHVPFLDITVLMCSCSSWRAECLSYLRRKRVSLLRQYFDDHGALLSLLRFTSSVISGDEVFDFALHGTDLPSLKVRFLSIHADCIHGAAVVGLLKDTMFIPRSRKSGEVRWGIVAMGSQWLLG